MTVLIGLGIYVLTSRTNATKKILANNKWIIALVAYILLSILWSNFPGISLRRAVRCIGTLVMVLVILTERSPLDAIRALLRRVFFLHIPGSIIAIKYFRNIGVVYNWNGIEEQWIGLSTDKNSLGQMAMCSGLYFLWELSQSGNWKPRFRKLRLPVTYLALSLWLLHGSKNSHSSTAILGFIACGLLLAGIHFIRKKSAQAKQLILASAIGLSILFSIGYALLASGDDSPLKAVVSATGRNMTFSGRTYLWKDLLNNSEKSPVFGVGIGAFWVGPVGYAMYPLPNWSLITPEWRPEQGHNGYIDTYLELGAVGTLLLLIVIGKAILGAIAELGGPTQALGALRIVLLMAILLNNTTESSFLRGEHALWFLFLLVAVNLPRPVRLSRSKRLWLSSADASPECSRIEVPVANGLVRR